MLLSVVLAAMFRSSEYDLQRKARFSENAWTELQERPLGQARGIPVTLYVPMRDGDLNDAMVGLFSDWRDLTFACSEHMTLLGLCLDIVEAIRGRRWTVFDGVSNSERVLVNILPLDETSRGSHQFRQTRVHEYGGRRTSPPRERKAWKSQHRPGRIT